MEQCGCTSDRRIESGVFTDLEALQLGFARTINLPEICCSIDAMLVRNLSSVPLSLGGIALLRRGIQFSVKRADHNASARARSLQLLDRFLKTLSEKLSCAHSAQTDRMITRARPRNSYTATAAYREFARQCAPLRPSSGTSTGYDMSFDQQSLIQFADKTLRSALLRAPYHGELNIEHCEHTALAEIRRNVKAAKTVIRKADKGRQIVVMNKVDYVSAVKKLLDDATNYKRVPFNGKYRAAALTIACVKKTAEKFPEYFKRDLLLFTKNPESRLLYALPKIHKSVDKWVDGMPPMRPICPDVRTESSMSAKFIASQLKPFMERIPSYIPNSYRLVERLAELRDLPRSAVLVTADVESLYPNIPIESAYACISNLLASSGTSTGLSTPCENVKTLILDLLHIQMNNNYFEFDNEYYLQVRGLPMGKAWAPAVACLFMSEWDRDWLSRLASAPRIYYRYIDDLFLIFDSPEVAHTAMRTANTINANIRLTDVKIDRTVSFLDVTIRLVDDGKVETSLYRKPTDLIVLLHLESAHEWRIKINVLLAQAVRIIKLSSDMQDAGHNIRILFETMRIFRGLKLRTLRKIFLRLLYWLGRASFVRHSNNYKSLATCSRKAQRVRRTVVSVPFAVNTRAFRNALRLVTDRISTHDKQYVGHVSIVREKGAQLSRLLCRI
jgi:hypothetical protein